MSNPNRKFSHRPRQRESDGTCRMSKLFQGQQTDVGEVRQNTGDGRVAFVTEGVANSPRNALRTCSWLRRLRSNVMPERLAWEPVPSIAKTRGKADIVAEAMGLCRMVVVQTDDSAKKKMNRVSRTSETIRKLARSTCDIMATRYLNAKLVAAIRSKCTLRPFFARSHKVRWDGIGL